MDKIKELVAKMTLEHKAGQLLMEDFVGRYALPKDLESALEKGHIGSVLYFSGCNVVDSFQLKELTNKLQNAAGRSPHSIPLFIAIDQECGQLSPITENISIHPGNMAVSAISERPEKHAYELGKIIANELKTIGLNINFAPVVDISHSDGLPIKDNRYFGSVPEKVAELGSAFIRGTQSENVIATAKHFPGQRNVDIDSHFELDVVDYPLDRLMNVEWTPFKKAIAAGVECMMTLHCAYTALDETNTPATLSKPIITGFLRDQLKYQGLVVSDDIQMEPIVKTYGADGAIVKAVQAGVDIIIISKEQREAYKVIVDAVKKGMISEERLNESVFRILKAKEKYAKPVNDDFNKSKKIIKSSISKNKIDDAANHSITLLKNEDKTLPLNPQYPERIAILRPTFGRLVMSDNTNFYRHNFTDSFNRYYENVFEYVYGLEPTPAEVLSISDWAFMADYTVFCTYNAYQYQNQLKAMEEILKFTTPDKVIAVALRSPEDIKYYPNDFKTVVATYGVARCSVDALFNLIFGKIKPSGKLPVNISDDYPLNHGCEDF